jgi:hypothetical protein
MVLQRAPARAAVYGWLGNSSHPSAEVQVHVAGTSTAGEREAGYTVEASVDATGKWKALLEPTTAGGNYTITARCVARCEGEIAISEVTFGDVWYCESWGIHPPAFRLAER